MCGIYKQKWPKPNFCNEEYRKRYKREYGDARPKTVEENEEILRKYWTRVWFLHRFKGLGVCSLKKVRECLEQEFPTRAHEHRRRWERPPAPKRDSIHPRERAAATIREMLYFHPLYMEEIGKGMDNFESWNPYIAKQYIKIAQEEVDKEWEEVFKWWMTVKPERKRKADEDALKKACEDLLRIERIEPEKEEEAVKIEEAAKIEGDMIARTIEFMIQKRKEYGKPIVCFVKTNCNAIWRIVGTPFRSREERKEWEEMSYWKRWMILINGPCGGIPYPWPKPLSIAERSRIHIKEKLREKRLRMKGL
ncbi:hypothetical protein OCU04_009504 [Sclerotinia nivalis]|uniref:Uncharacterized protein n=1 Tax=Sclerotinia nivalis TaxID=352851 RepID=A0A9X0AG29_9HELO|nr:hypothetical protein OCU04_009504 [Sclerotinia nivalis]